MKKNFFKIASDILNYYLLEVVDEFDNYKAILWENRKCV